MRRFSAVALIFSGGAYLANGQGRSIDWPFYGGDAQRTGWEKSDSRITKDNVKDFQLVLKRKLENGRTGPRSLTAPVVIGNLISYRGFKELAVVTGSSDNVWSIDADLNKMFWHRHFDSSSAQPTSIGSGTCLAGLTATPALTPGLTFGAGRPRTPSGSAASGPPGASASPAGAPAPFPRPAGPVTPIPPRPLFVISSDGKLHRLNTSDGTDQFPPVNFLPANTKASSLVVRDNVVYTTTSSGCGGAPDAVWAIDLSGATPKIASFALNGGGVLGLGGMALGNDGTVYVQTGDGPFAPASNKWSNTVLALTPKDLKLKQYFTDPNSGSSDRTAPEMNVSTPVVFAYKGRDLIVSAGRDGRLHVLDSQSLGGDNHKTPFSETAPISSAAKDPNHGIWGGLSSWENTDGTRWVIAPVWGPVSSELKFPLTNGAAPHGSYVAFRLEEQEGKPILAPAWMSRDMNSPEPPGISSGLVFALSAGEYTREADQDRPKDSTHATLYVLDATTGKDLYSTGNQVTAPGNLTGLTIVNGRVYFTTTDNTLYAFGIPLEIY